MRYVILAPVALLIWAAILFPIATAVHGLLRWRGSWRLASVAPLLVAFPFFAAPREYWGLIFIPLSMLLSAYSGALVLLHRKRSRG